MDVPAENKSVLQRLFKRESPVAGAPVLPIFVYIPACFSGQIMLVPLFCIAWLLMCTCLDVQAQNPILLSCGKTMLPMGTLRKFNQTALQQSKPGRNRETFLSAMCTVWRLGSLWKLNIQLVFLLDVYRGSGKMSMFRFMQVLC